MLMKYQVINWQKHFENDRSRSIDDCAWVKLPNKDGMSLSYILSLPEGCVVFSVFIRLIQSLSKQRLPREGWMTFDGTPWGEPWPMPLIAIRVMRPEAEVAHALDILSSVQVGWVRKYSNDNELPERESGNVQNGSQLPSKTGVNSHLKRDPSPPEGMNEGMKERERERAAKMVERMRANKTTQGDKQ